MTSWYVFPYTSKVHVHVSFVYESTSFQSFSVAGDQRLLWRWPAGFPLVGVRYRQGKVERLG